MNWLSDLLFNPDSIAHIVALYAFVIAVGVLLDLRYFAGGHICLVRRYSGWTFWIYRKYLHS